MPMLVTLLLLLIPKNLLSHLRSVMVGIMWYVVSFFVTISSFLWSRSHFCHASFFFVSPLYRTQGTNTRTSDFLAGQEAENTVVKG